MMFFVGVNLPIIRFCQNFIGYICADRKGFLHWWFDTDGLSCGHAERKMIMYADSNITKEILQKILFEETI